MDKDFDFGPGFIPSIVMKMERSNATIGTSTFENCKALLGYDVVLILKDPRQRQMEAAEAAQEKVLQKTWKRWLRNKLTSMGLIA